MDNILFDLDGTITDPFLGITKSVAYSLKSFGIEVESLDELKKFIGPPLVDSFQEYYHMSEEESLKAVDKYREYFKDTGLFENEAYEGIEKLLWDLSIQDKKLYICTSKPYVFALRILNHFGLSQYFDGIYGSELSGLRNAKKDVIEYCIQKEHLDVSRCIMVGDRKHDVIGAHAHQIPCVGVLYGYGSQEEFEACECDKIVRNLDELKNYLLG